MSAPSRLGSTWALLLAGPVIATTYFLVVYLLAEAACSRSVSLFSTGALRAVIVAGAVGTLAVFGAYAARARRLWTMTGTTTGQPEQNQRFMVITGLMLLGLFAMFVLFLAAPAVGTSLC
jgi:hypothetical protein